MKKILNKTNYFPKYSLTFAYLIAFLVPVTGKAEQPNWEVWDEYENTIIVSQETEKLLGHRPGMDTFPLIKKSAGGIPGQLELCDTVKINYRILDKDGDWADDIAIRESVEWFVYVDNEIDNTYMLVSNESTDSNIIPFDERYRDFEDTKLTNEEALLSLKLLDHIKLLKDGEVQPDNLKAFIIEAEASGKEVHLGYRLWPKTAIGDPFEANTLAEVNQFEKVTQLPPEVEVDSGNPQIIVGDAIQTVVENYDLASRFLGYDADITSNKLSVGNNDCVLAPPVESNPFLIGYYKVDANNPDNTVPVSYLATDNQYQIRFFYDKNNNGMIDVDEDEDVTQELLADEAKDHLGRPFKNGIRLDLSFNLRGINLNSYDESGTDASIFSDTTAIGENENTEVKVRGLPLDEFRNFTDRFFWLDANNAQRNLYFQTIEGEPIPTEILDINLAPKVLPDYFIAAEDALSLQGFKINVRTSYPAWTSSNGLNEGDSQ